MYSQIVSLGAYLQTALSGMYSQIVSLDTFLQTVSLGVYSRIMLLGRYLQTTLPGVYSQIVSLDAFLQTALPGMYFQIVSLGAYLQTASSGTYLHTVSSFQVSTVLNSSVLSKYAVLLKIKLSFLQSMVKADSPPTKKGGKKLEGIKEEEELSDEDKTNSENIEKFLLTIPCTTWSQFLAAISSSDFLKTFATALGNFGTFQVKFGNDETTPSGNKDAYSDAYAAFLASQTQTSKEEYERFRSNYAAKNCFGQVKIPLQTFQSGFQVTLTPRLGDQTIVNVVLQKGDCGDSPVAR